MAIRFERNANVAQFPLMWQEVLDFVTDMNRQQMFGFNDWCLPNRRELRSLMRYKTRKPALPEGHPFTNVFLGWYWSSTSAAISPAHAWYVHMEGALNDVADLNQAHQMGCAGACRILMNSNLWLIVQHIAPRFPKTIFSKQCRLGPSPSYIRLLGGLDPSLPGCTGTTLFFA